MKRKLYSKNSKMKKFSFLLVFLAGLLFVVQSCKRKSIVQDDTPPDIISINIDDLKAPEGFNFETSKDLYVRVKIANPISPTTKYLIRIYSNVPGTGELVTTGLTNKDFEYSTSVRLPAGQEFLWIEKVDPDGSSEFNEVAASTFVTSMFNSKPENVYTFQKRGSGMNCKSSCNTTYNNHKGNLNFTKKGTYCITGEFNGSITVGKDVTVKICANGSITNLILNSKKSKVYILEGAELKITNLVTNNKDAEVGNWSDSVIVLGSMSQNGEIKNYGKFYVNGSMTINSKGEFKNYGTLSVGGSMSINDDMDNYHFMSVGGSVSINSKGELKSYCNLTIKGSITINDELEIKGGLTKIGGSVTVNSKGEIKLDRSAVLTCDDITINGEVEGKGSKLNIIKVADRTVINSNGELKGKINLCDNDGVEINTGKLKSGAKISCDGSIAKSTCNPEGFSNVVVKDDDNDGIVNEQDAYPNDANKAFDAYYPSASTYVNIGFEDLWPNKGDFDFNDMVIAYNVHKILDADKKVVEAIFKVNVRSVGGSFDNGFGFRLDDIQSSVISTVSGYTLSKNIVKLNANKTEAAQDKAVIICFDSPEPTLNRVGGSFFNTIKANAKGTSDTLTIRVQFSTPQDESKLAASKLNPFIFTNQRRGYEVHLGDFVPTSLADKTLFGTGQDASNTSTGKYYKTANNLPWAILIEETFDYPEEKAPINVAYRYFNEWAMSGGKKQARWYRNLALHRNINKVFE